MSAGNEYHCTHSRISTMSKSRRNLTSRRTAGARVLIEALEKRKLLTAIAIDNPLSTQSSSPTQFVGSGGTAYFAASAPAAALWKTNGTAAGTSEVQEFATGVGYSAGAAASINGSLYVAADFDGSGTELWKVDGSSGNLTLLKDINPGIASSNPRQLTIVGSTVYFIADDGIHGDQLWKTNGTPSGTTMVTQINATGTSSPDNLTALNGTLYFTANDGVHGTELWKTDGSAAGTVMVSDINPGASSSSPSELTVAGGTLYFAATNANFTDDVLWQSDGTATGTKPVVNSAGLMLSRPASLINVSGTLYFAALFQRQSTLLKTDGTPAGTQVVSHATPSTDPSTAPNIAVCGGKLCFIRSFNNTPQLWISDGTPTGTLEISESAKGDLTTLGNRVYFEGTSIANGVELWSTDGTSSGTQQVMDIFPGPGDSWPEPLQVANGKLFFAADDGLHGVEPWVSDGTAAGTHLIADLNTAQAPTVASPPFAAPDGSAYFDAPRGLYHVDRSGDAPVFLGPQGGESFTSVGTQVFFVAGPPSDQQLWETDGTPAGTHQVIDFPDQVQQISDLFAFGGRVYFGASLKGAAEQLWTSDASASGTYPLLSAGPTQPVYPTEFTAVGGSLFFQVIEADGPNAGPSIWRTDGTPAGTSMAVSLLGGNAIATNVYEAATSLNGNFLYYAVGPYNAHLDLLAGKTDTQLTDSGMLVDALDPGKSFGVLNGVAYFFADGLWRTDGTAAGTYKVTQMDDVDIQAGITRVGKYLYFLVERGIGVGAPTGEYQLWRTDGTATGTLQLMDIPPAGVMSGGNPLIGNITDVGGEAYFPANTAATGNEIWKSDGSPAGTLPATDVNPPTSNSSESNLSAADGVMYFLMPSVLPLTNLWKFVVPPPAAPGQLTAVNSSGLGVDLAWIDNSGGAASFRVERSDDAKFATIDESVMLQPGVTQFHDANVIGGATYYYRVYSVAQGVDCVTPPVASVTFKTQVASADIGNGAGSNMPLQTAPDGISLLPSGRSIDIPLSGLAQIQINLAAPANLSAGDVAITGSSGAPQLFTLSGSGQAWTISLDQPITTPQRITLVVSGPAIEPFNRQINVLPGDINDDGAVSFSDFVYLALHFGQTVGAESQLSGDLNGDGVVNFSDFIIVAEDFGHSLPSPVTAPAGAAAPALVRSATTRSRTIYAVHRKAI